MQYNESEFKNILQDLFANNFNIKPTYISLISLLPGPEKYIGSVLCKNNSGRDVVVCANCNSARTLLYYPDTGETEFIGNLSGISIGYSCAVFYPKDGCVYGCPRNSNKLLKIDINKKETVEIDIGLDVSEDVTDNKYIGHHYGGVLIGDKIVLPPRKSKYILIIDLQTYTHRQIYDDLFKNSGYNSVIEHPNGKLYFMPFKGSAVMEFDPQTEKMRTIGGRVPFTIIGSCVYSDGKIYGFTKRGNGLACVDIEKKECRIIAEKADDVLMGWSYGTIVHPNGKLYNIPGSSMHVFEYDPRTGASRVVAKFDDGRYNGAKWAGGVLLPNGNIFFTACTGRFIAELKFSDTPVFPEKARSMLYDGVFKTL